MLFLEWVGGEANHVFAFGRPWQHLQQERIARITRPHPGDEPSRHEQRKLAGSAACIRRKCWIECQQSAELFGITDGVGQFPLPAAVRMPEASGLHGLFGWLPIGRCVEEWQGRHRYSGSAVASG